MATWQLDNAHSSADFTVRHMMVTNVRGSFGTVSGTIEFDPENPAAASVNATIDVSTINTNNADRDGHLRSGDFFDVETYPSITFKSTNVEPTGDNTANITGDLTIRDITKPVTLEVEYLFGGTSPFGDVRAGFEARGSINREEFGLTWNQALESGGVLVGKDVKISLDVQGVKVTEEATA
ncbi:MAG: YceI family protein [Chloroflexota bacterium]